MGVEHVGAEPSVDPGHALARHLGRHAQPRDEEDLLQRRGELGRRVVAQPALELVQDRIARVPAHADDEGKAELRLVGIVQPMEARELLLRQRVEADARLLVPEIRRSPRLRGRPCRRDRDGRAGTRAAASRGAARTAPIMASCSAGYRWRRTPLGGRAFRDPGRQLERCRQRRPRNPRALRDSRSASACDHAGRPSTPAVRLYSPAMQNPREELAMTGRNTFTRRRLRDGQLRRRRPDSARRCRSARPPHRARRPTSRSACCCRPPAFRRRSARPAAAAPTSPTTCSPT